MKRIFLFLLLATVARGATYDYPVKTATNALSASKALTTDANGKAAASATTSTEIGYVSGVTSAIQTQLDAKGAATNGTFTGGTFTGATNSLPIVSDYLTLPTSSAYPGNMTYGGRLYYATNVGLIAYGAGSTYDFAVLNKNGVTVMAVPTGSTASTFGGQVYVTGSAASSNVLTLKLATSQTAPVIQVLDPGGTQLAMMDATYRGWQFGGLFGMGTDGLQSPHGSGYYANIGCDQHGSMLIGQNVWVTNNNLFISQSHASLAGAAIKIPGAGKTRQGNIEFWTTPTASVTADAAITPTSPNMLLDTAGKLGVGVTSPQYTLDLAGQARILGTNGMRFGGTSGATDDTVTLYQSAANVLTVNATTRVEMAGNLNVGFTGSGVSTFNVKSSSSRPAVIQSTVALTSDAIAYRDQYGYYLAGVDSLAYVFQPTGVSTNRNRMIGTVKTDTTSVANTGTSETNLMSYTFPAGGLAATGDSAVLEGFGTTAANGNTKTVRVYFGATKLADSGNITASGVAWRVNARIVRTGAATQIAICTISVDGMTTVTTHSSPTETLSGTVVAKVTGQSATASSDVTQTFQSIEFKPAN